MNEAKTPSNLNDSLDGFVESFIGDGAPLLPPSDKPVSDQGLPELHKETCKKCRGSGRFIGYTGRDFGPCHACKGRGFNMYRTSEADRKHAKDLREGRKTRGVDAWRAEHPAEAAWLDAAAARGFNLAIDIKNALVKYGGDINEQKMALIRRFMAQDAERAAQRQAAEASAPAVSVQPIADAFGRAQASGLKWPKVTIAEYTFKPASASSKNAGSLYVTTGGTYLGRITDGKLVASKDCGQDRLARIVAICADPKAAAIEHGKVTGCCAICSRELTNDESIERGIGPICARKFGW